MKQFLQSDFNIKVNHYAVFIYVYSHHHSLFNAVCAYMYYLIAMQFVFAYCHFVFAYYLFTMQSLFVYRLITRQFSSYLVTRHFQIISP